MKKSQKTKCQTNIVAKGCTREAKGSRRAGKGTRREPKGDQREPKVAKRSKKGAKMEARGRKREPRAPKGSQIVTKRCPKIGLGARVDVRCQKWSARPLRGEHFGRYFLPKNQSKIDATIVPKKTRNFMKTHPKKGHKIDAKSYEISTSSRKGVCEKSTIIAGLFAQNHGWAPSQNIKNQATHI